MRPGSKAELFLIYAVGSAITTVVCAGAGLYVLAALSAGTAVLATVLTLRSWRSGD